MGNIVEWVQANWITITAIVLAVSTCLKAIRDAIDTSPETDDNKFERFCTIFGKVVAYIFMGKRAA